MKNILLPACAVLFILFGFYSGNENSGTIAIYDLDSVQRGNERFQTEYKRAEALLDSDRKMYETLSEDLAPKKTNTDYIPVPKNQMPSGIDPGKLDKDRQQAKKRIKKDSIYLYDSLPILFENRVKKIACDFQKQFGYMAVLTKGESGTYLLDSANRGSKTKNVTRSFIEFSNQDSIAQKY